MESKNLVSMVLALTVGIICIGAVMVPVLSEATTTEKTFTNEGLYRMSLYGTDANISATWDYTDPEVMTINGSEVELPDPSASAFFMTLIGNDGLMLRYGIDSGSIFVQLFDSTSNNVRLMASETNQTNMTISIASGTATFTVGSNSVNVTYDDGLFFISADGDYVMKSATSSVYVLEDSKFYGIGRSSILIAGGTNTQSNLYVEGSIADGFTVSGMYYTLLSSSNHVNAVSVGEYIGLYKLTGVTFNTVYDDNGTEYSKAQTYTQIIVPYEVTAELTSHLSSAAIALVMVLPLMVIIAVMMFAVRYIARD